MLRLVIAPTPVFLIRALGDKMEYFKKWDKRIEKEVFQLANLSHDYIRKEELDQKDEKEQESLIAKWTKDEREKTITMHENGDITRAKSLIGLSSREGGLGVMKASGIAINAFVASSANSITILNKRKIKFSISTETNSKLHQYFNGISNNNVDNPDVPQELRELILNLDNIQASRLNPNAMRGLQGRLTKLKEKSFKESLKKTLNSYITPLFEDHQGKNANRVLIKPPTMTKTFQIEDSLMQETISQTLLLPNDMGFKQCYGNNTHGNQIANHMNSCSNYGKVQRRHDNAKKNLRGILRMLDLPTTNEPVLTEKGTKYRGDISVTDPRAVIDVTCVQTSQNHKTLEKAFEAAYENKIQKYNDMKEHGKLKNDYTETRLIPVVIGPRGQFYSKSWTALTNFLGIKNTKATNLAALEDQPLNKNTTSPDLASKTISFLKALSFRVAVDTMRCARDWQDHQREHWRETTSGINNIRKRPVVIDRPVRN